MIKAIFEFLKNMLGFGEKIAENKSIKIPMKEESIRSEAHKDAVRDNIKADKKEAKYDRAQELEKWYARAKLLGLSNRQRKKLNKKIKNNILSGYTIKDLSKDDVIV